MEINPKSSETRIKMTLTEGQESTTIDALGELDNIIVSSLNKVSIIVKSSLGYLIFHEREHEGTKYYAPRAHVIAPERSLQHAFQFDKFFLNEPIEIIVNGRKGEEVSILIRFC